MQVNAEMNGLCYTIQLNKPSKASDFGNAMYCSRAETVFIAAPTLPNGRSMP